MRGWWISASSQTQRGDLPESLSQRWENEGVNAEFVSVNAEGTWFARFPHMNYRLGLDTVSGNPILHETGMDWNPWQVTFGFWNDFVADFFA